MTRAAELAAVRADLTTWKPKPKRPRTGTTPALQTDRQRLIALPKENRPPHSGPKTVSPHN